MQPRCPNNCAMEMHPADVFFSFFKLQLAGLGDHLGITFTHSANKKTGRSLQTWWLSGQWQCQDTVFTSATLYCTLHMFSRARILKHLLEAEKSTFQGELSFQRSECTAGLTVASFFVVF
jgi:hypothetical protein